MEAGQKKRNGILIKSNMEKKKKIYYYYYPKTEDLWESYNRNEVKEKKSKTLKRVDKLSFMELAQKRGWYIDLYGRKTLPVFYFYCRKEKDLTSTTNTDMKWHPRQELKWESVPYLRAKKIAKRLDMIEEQMVFITDDLPF